MNIRLERMTDEMYHQYFKEYKNDVSLFLDRSKYVEYEYSKERVDEYILKQHRLNRISLAIMVGEEIAGEILFKDYVKENKVTLSICLKNDSFKNQGIGTQGEILAIDYALNDLHVKIVNADTIKTNVRSQRVLEKVGFKKVKEENDFIYYQFKTMDNKKD